MQALMFMRLFLFILTGAGFFIVERYFSGHGRFMLLRGISLGFAALITLIPAWGYIRAKRQGLAAEAKNWLYVLSWQVLLIAGVVLYIVYGKYLGLASEPDTPVAKLLLGLWLTTILLAMFLGIGVEFAFSRAGRGPLAEPKRLQKSAQAWLTIGLITASLVALNYGMTKKNRSYDWSYLKTSSVSESTLKIIEQLSTKVDVAVFFPVSNEVLQQLKDYFDSIAQKSKNISIQYYDKDIDPMSAEKFQTTRNGQVVLATNGNFERIDLGLTVNSARKQLRSFDQEFQKSLLTLTSERKTVYFSSGHGELSWKGKSDQDPLRSIRLLETFLRNQNYLLKFWGAGDGSLKEVPRDASIVVVAGATKDFLEEETQALREYLNQGGSLMTFLDLDSSTDESLQVSKGRNFDNDPYLKFLAAHGIRYIPTPLANAQNFVSATHSPIDHWFLYTNNFASHESIGSLNRNDEKVAILTFKSGYLSQSPEFGGWQSSETVRSMPEVFNDDDKNFEFTAGKNEKRNAYLLGSASIKKGTDKKVGKMITFADASAISDALIRNSGNLLYFSDSFKWLVGQQNLQGQLATEEDVRIQHTQKQDLVWFYGSVMAVPALVLFAGFVANRRGKRRGAVA